MAISKLIQLDSIEMLPGDRFRIRLTTYFVDGVTEIPSREPDFVTLNPAVPAHQPAISALRSAWNATLTATQADR